MRCSTCGAYIETRHDLGYPHVCPPIWHVHWVDYHAPGEAKEIRARNALDAAEKYARWSDAQGDYEIVQGGEGIFVVWDENKENPLHVAVASWTEPVYQATKNKDPIPLDLLQAPINQGD